MKSAYAQVILLMICISGLHAQDGPVPSRPVPAKKLWHVSLVTLAAANALDVHSSWGKRELNPTLATPSVVFGREATLIKVGMVGGVMAVEYLFTRRRPAARLYRALSFINFGAGGADAGVAIHNYMLPRAPR